MDLRLGDEDSRSSITELSDTMFRDRNCITYSASPIPTNYCVVPPDVDNKYAGKVYYVLQRRRRGWGFRERDRDISVDLTDSHALVRELRYRGIIGRT